MFGSSKRRRDALLEAVTTAEQMMQTQQTLPVDALQLLAHDLTSAMDAVWDNDRSAVLSSADGQALYDRAETLMAAVKSQQTRRIVEERQAQNAVRAKELANKLRITRCSVCSGGSFMVREEVRVDSWHGQVKLSMVVCTTCGDVRLRVPSPEDLAHLMRDENNCPVSLPDGGPFRG
ncbi:MAG: hypothetical protein Q8Q09_16710 [Deltaproteobacteria bacterium]|nr:hypothetical protein [Deltaproteobacteria bacterium]